MKLRSYLILRSTEGGEGGTEGEKPTADKTVDAVKALLKSHGNDAARAVQAVMTDRDKLAGQLEELRGKLPKDGHRVIDPDTAKALDEYTALGHKPADLAKALAERDELGKWKAGRERADHLAKVAGLHGFKAPVLTTLAERDNLEIVVADDKDPKTQKPVQVAKVKGKDAEGKETLTPLPDYAEKHWGDFREALSVSPRPATIPLGSPPAPNGAPRPPVVNQDSASRYSRPLVR